MSQQKLMSSSLLVLMLSLVSFANDSCAMMKSGSAEEKTTTSVSKPFVFHDIEGGYVALEENKALLKMKLAEIKDKKILNALSRLESPNENLQKKAADDIILWAIDNDQTLLQPAKHIKVFYQNLPYERLENLAAHYFIKRFALSGSEQLSFLEKTSGVKLGRRLVVRFFPSGSKTFFIKTHRHGTQSNSSMSSGAKAVDPKEVLVYNVLHQLGLGPETHFFWEDQKNFYIATEDLNGSGSFIEYSKLYEQLPNPEKTSVKELSQEYFHICDELIKMDVISRILRLSDTTTNKENFGFVEKIGSQFLCLIDFDVKDDDVYTSDGLFKGFLAGNGTFMYATNTDPTIKYALAKRIEDDRTQLAANFFEEFNILEAVNASMANVSEISQRLKIDTEDLSNYYKGIKKNIQLFKEGLGLDVEDDVQMSEEDIT